MNRRRFLGTVAAVAAAAVGAVTAKAQPNLYGSRKIDVPSRWPRMVVHDYVYNAAPRGWPYYIYPNERRMVFQGRVPDDLAQGDILFWRDGRLESMSSVGVRHDLG